jgi:DNA-directed RNA polymerase subunit L
MQIEIISQDKNSVELKIDNQTVAEIIRIYLNEQGIDFAAWRREHPTKPTIFRIQAKDKPVKKAVSDATSAIIKDLDKFSSLLKKK